MPQNVENASPGATPPGINAITALSSNSPSTLEAALAWAARGFRVFPIAKGTKDDFIIKNWATEASSDPMMIRAWWRTNGKEENHNIGCLTTGMVVVDLDVKNGQLGPQSFDSLGLEMSSLVVQTASGGFHIYYDGPSCSNRAGLLGVGSGIDIRSYNGYVLAPGSTYNGGSYKVFRDGEMELLPDVLMELMVPPGRRRLEEERGQSDDSPEAIAQAKFYLLEQAPVSIVGKNGNNTAYKVAAKLTSDFGLSGDKALDLLLEHWNPRCLPPWSERELESIVDHSESYAKGDKGAGTIAAMIGDNDALDEYQKTVAAEDDSKEEEADVVETSDNEWPELKPLQSALLPVLPLTPDLLPAALRGFVVDTAERQPCPADYVAIGALVGLASLLGNAARVQPRAFDTKWQTVPVFWGCLVGRPSAKKTPALNAALAPLEELERELSEEWKAASIAAQRQADINKIACAAYRKKAQEKFDAGQEDTAMIYLNQALDAEQEVEKPPHPRLIVNDSTIEKLGELLSENPGGLLLKRDELSGVFAIWADQNRQGERSFYLEAYNGGTYASDRIGRGYTRVERCTLSIVGTIQPDKIAPFVAGGRSRAADDGLIQRFQMAVWPDALPEFKFVDRAPDSEAEESYRAAFRKLFEFRKARIASGSGPAVFRFNPEAQGIFDSWYVANEREAVSGNLSTVMESHIGKLANTVLTLALIFEMVENKIAEQFEINVSAIEMAIRWVKYLRSHSERIYSRGDTICDGDMESLFQRRNLLPSPFTAREIKRKGWGGLTDDKMIGQALAGLIERGYLKGQTTKGAGRATTNYRWNPKFDRKFN